MMRPSSLGLSLLLALVLVSGVAHARTQLADTPCAGCKVVLSPSPGPVPLLVLLHGDSGYGPSDLVNAWERHVAAHGIALLALKCPKELGCKGSWWQWNGDPSWITARIDALAAKRPIDRERVWLAGWSGGASYMGLHAPELQRTFAALVYHGGGVPTASSCGAVSGTKVAPVLFLVGTGNPLHRLAVGLRARHEACGDEIVWKALPNADHAAEWRALDAHGDAIVLWLLRQRRPGP